jgi:hypothetical protein
LKLLAAFEVFSLLLGIGCDSHRLIILSF